LLLFGDNNVDLNPLTPGKPENEGKRKRREEFQPAALLPAKYGQNLANEGKKKAVPQIM